MPKSLTPIDAARLMDRCRRDPVFFCVEVLGVEPWAKQREVLEALRDADRVAVRSGHGTGKSCIAAVAALWFLYAHHPAKVVTTAPTRAQVRSVLWNEIRARHAAARLPLGGSVYEERIALGPDAFAVGVSTDETERFQGYHAERILVVLDEAPGVRTDIWNAAETLCTGRVSRMLAVGNPVRPSGRFRRCFDVDGGWRRVAISCLDSPNLDGDSRWPALVTRRWIDDMASRWGEDSPVYRSRVLGEFPDDADGTLFPSEALEAAAAVPIPEARSRPRLGVDVARTGSDETVFCIRDDRGVRHMEARSGWSTMQTAGRTVRLMERAGVPAERVFIDDTGVGAGVVDRLRELGHAVRAVVLGGGARDRDHFANIRAECYWRLREAVLRGGDDGPFGLSGDDGPFGLSGDDELVRDLAGLRYELTSSGAILLESKDGLRARLGRSPDRADALALTFADGETAFDPEVTLL